VLPKSVLHCGLGEPPADGCAPAVAFGGRNGVGKGTWARTCDMRGIRNKRDFIAMGLGECPS
jgi:hypothetical protein